MLFTNMTANVISSYIIEVYQEMFGTFCPTKCYLLVDDWWIIQYGICQ